MLVIRQVEGKLREAVIMEARVRDSFRKEVYSGKCTLMEYFSWIGMDRNQFSELLTFMRNQEVQLCNNFLNYCRTTVIDA